MTTELRKNAGALIERLENPLSTYWTRAQCAAVLRALVQGVERLEAYVEAQPCRCSYQLDGDVLPDDQCDRCQALGETQDQTHEGS